MSGDDTTATNDGPGATRSELSGQAENVLQARDVSGGVHFHSTAPRLTGPVPHQLPGDVRGFVNRTAVIDQLNAAVGDGQPTSGESVLLITGTAGVGKTSLAVHWAHQARPQFPDGQLYINLRGYDPGEPVSAGQALERFLLALGIPATAIPADVESRSALFRSLLASRRILLVLDNAATVGQVRPLLPGAGTSVALVTGRSRLSGLVARDGARRFNLDVLDDPAAAELLQATMASYRSGDDEDEIEELSRLCARLPLALRIAAERAAARPHLPLDALISDLRNESSLWDTLSTDDDEEASAVRTVFAWSYRALSPEAAVLFRRLGLHPSPEFSASAAAVLSGDTLQATRPLLDQLAGAHLIEQTGSDRFQFHDLLRAYATGEVHHTDSADDSREVLRRLLTWYLETTHAAVARTSEAVATQPSPDASTSGASAGLQFPTTDSALDWLLTERDNVSSSVRTAAASGLDDLAWQLAAAGFHDSIDRSSPASWRPIGLVALESARRVGNRSGEARVLECLGIAARLARRLPEAIGYHTAALDLYREQGDRTGQAKSVNALGLIHARGRNLDAAIACFREAMAMAEEDGDTFRLGIIVGNLGNAYYELGENSEAERLLRSALAMTRAIGDRYHEADTLHDLSKALQSLGELAEARTSAEHGLSLARSLRNQVLEGALLTRLGDCQRACGENEAALVSLQGAAVIHRLRGDASREATTFDHTGEAYRAAGRFEEALDFHRRAAAMHHDLGDEWRLLIALDNLAAALDAVGRAEEAADTWREAMELASRYHDKRATALRERIAGALQS